MDEPERNDEERESFAAQLAASAINQANRDADLLRDLLSPLFKFLFKFVFPPIAIYVAAAIIFDATQGN